MEVSINILNFNTYEKSCVCIDSCLNQIGIEFQILLIDNASTDDSFDRLKKKYGDRIQYLQTGMNYGYAGGNNCGVKFCLENHISYVLLLNSDTELVGNTLLSNLVKIAKTNDNCAIVAPTIYEVRNKELIKYTNDSSYNRYLRKIRTLPHNRVISTNLKTISEAHGSALLVKCQDFLQVGGFPDHYFMYCEESTLSKKILWSKRDIIWYNSDTNYVFHHHDYTKQTSSWMLILGGRNRFLEFSENCKWSNFSWILVFLLLIFKTLILSLANRNNKYLFKGMILGFKQSVKKISHKEKYTLGKEIYLRYKDKLN